ncbi:MAG: hypothetical protein KDA63_00380 [Planctomycetales bacterium]|nr:hypothetical protein [Planctomycetales bacterium]
MLELQRDWWQAIGRAIAIAGAALAASFAWAEAPGESLCPLSSFADASDTSLLVLATSGPAKRPLPSFAEVEQIVAAHFSKAELEGDTVISKGQVKPMFYALAKAGWRVEDAEEIYKLVPDDDSFLVQQMRSTDGVSFARDVAQFPGAWDTIDRLAAMPFGHNTIRALVRGPDGYKMIEYITTTPGGANMAAMLSQAPTGRDFMAPTGKIYTVSMLMERLKQSYAAAKASQPQAT